MTSPPFPPVGSLPSTQSLPDLSLSLQRTLSSSTNASSTLSPPLHPHELGPERKEQDLLDDDPNFISPPPPNERSYSNRSTHKQENDQTPRKLDYKRSTSNLSSSLALKTSRSPLLPQDSFSRSHHHHRRSSSSASISSVSSLGSIHSAPELLLQPPSTLEPLESTPSPPPELVRRQSSFDRRRGGRESIAVMENHHHGREREESRVSQESPQEEERFIGEEEEEESPDETRDGKGKSSSRRRRRKREFPSTLWEYLKEEVCTVEIDGQEGIKSERVTNFLTVPKELEKIISFGFIICLDSFLYTFTILPLRSLSALYSLLSRILFKLFHPRTTVKSLSMSHKADLIKMVIVVITGLSLHRVTDASKMYHGVRGQETIKLYVLFNVLEIADRLCCSFGQDLSDSLFSSTTLSRSSSQSQRIPSPRPIALFLLYTLYVISHSLVLFYQLVTLNVAVNSYSNALLTLLLSNQFVEIKGSVFKKFEKENLFQMTCADIVERFQLALMLFIISLRNLIELSTSTLPSPSSTSSALSPYLPDPALVLKTFSPALTVLVSECFVDWLKHAFITKFNHIRPGVYGRYIDVLCKDLIKGQSGGGSNSQEIVDQSPSVSRRLGFAALPLSCLVIRVFSQAFEILGDESGMDECLMPSSSPSSSSPFVVGHRKREGVEDVWEVIGKWAGIGGVVLLVWICLITLKLLIGINLRTFASERWNALERVEREEEDWKNGRSRKGIGISLNETVEIEKTNKLLRDKKFDEPTKAGLGGGGGKKEIELENIGRYDMIRSRLW